MQNNNKNQIHEENELIKCYNTQDQDQYIFFLPTVPEYIKHILYQKDSQIRQRQFNELYKRLSGQQDDLQQYLDQGKFVQVLKNIHTFGCSEFSGNICYSMTSQTQILLNLTYIENITFPNLKLLNFQNCSLFSIEVLAWLDMKTTQEIWLQKNMIVSLKPLGKSSFSELKQLRISQNPFQSHQLKCFQRIHSSKLQSVAMYKKFTYLQNLQVSKSLLKLQINDQKNETQQRLQIYCGYKRNIAHKNKLQDLIKNHTLIEFK